MQKSKSNQYWTWPPFAFNVLITGIMDMWMPVCSPWSSSREWFQTRKQSIACLTEWSTSGRASPSHWDSEELSSALKGVRTHCLISFILISSHSLSTFYKWEKVHARYNFHTFILCLSLCLQRSGRQRFSTKCFLMKNLLEVLTSGDHTKWICSVELSLS